MPARCVTASSSVVRSEKPATALGRRASARQSSRSAMRAQPQPPRAMRIARTSGSRIQPLSSAARRSSSPAKEPARPKMSSRYATR